MEMKTLYVVGPENKGDGVYGLISEDGEMLATHMCSNASFARGDLHDTREERKLWLKKRFGDYKVIWLGDDDMDKKELERRNHEWFNKQIPGRNENPSK